MESTYFRRGFGLKKQIEPLIEAEYHSDLVEGIRARGYTQSFGDGEHRLTVRLAEEFGFCYGVDRAVDYAYETRTQFPDRRILLVGEIIHNPHVNRRLREMGIIFMYPAADGVFDFGEIGPDDVVILPAFGVTLGDFGRLRETGCVLVDTTCGSVLNVWKRVEQYSRDGFTALIHGKHHHEETKATASQAFKHPDGHYLIVRHMDEARRAMDYIERLPGAFTRQEFLEFFAGKTSPGFDPDLHLDRIGVANQTTMLAGESLAIAAEVGRSLERRFGAEPGFRLDAHFRSFDTICSATQERQDAVAKLLATDPLPDLMLVIGGYNSSNTNNLAIIADERVPASYHIASGDCIEGESIRHKPAGTPLDDREEVKEENWLPDGPIRIGLTAGASTPNSQIGLAIGRILEARGLSASLALR